MSMKDQVLKILDDCGNNVADAVKEILNGPQAILIYVLKVGLETMRSRRRASTRRELRAEVQPQFRPGRSTGSVVFTERTKKKIVEHSKRLFSEWEIGPDHVLGMYTKEDLLSQASNERKSARGNIRNAMFYEALAEPLAPHQKVKDFWKVDAAQAIKRGIYKDTKHKTPELV